MFPKIVEVGSFALPTYGVLIAIGFLAALALSIRLAPRSGLDPDRVGSLALVLLLSAIAGAKVFMVIDEWGYYSANPDRLFSLAALRSGGVFYGGLLAAIAVAYYYTRRHRMPWLTTADTIVPGLAFGHAVGRLGCFAAGCCWGRESHVAWSVVFTDPAAHSFTGVPLNVPLHPTQLYEALGTAAIGLLLLWLFLRPHAPGIVLGSYLMLYSAFRFGVEFFRDESARTLLVSGSISSTQVVAAGLAVAGLLLIRKVSSQPQEPMRPRRRRNRKR